MDSSLTASRSIPLIDIRPWTEPDDYTDADRLTVAQQVDHACRLVGFFAIQHHGVKLDIISQAWSASQEFFDLPLETKLASKTDDERTYPYGYENIECLVVGKTKVDHSVDDETSVSPTKHRPDTKETFSLGPPEGSGMPDRRFPAHPACFEPAMIAYYQAMEQLSLTLMRVFAVALELPSPEYFDSYLNKHWSALRALNYPAMQDNGENAETTLVDRIRAGEHTDYGALTILRTDGPGLQVQTMSDAGVPQWTNVPVLKDENVFIINLGDMMQRWTNDEWVSTLHRVVVVKDDDGKAYSRRQSMAYFCNVHGHALVSPLSTCRRDKLAKYEPILAKDHLMAKHLASMGYNSSANKEDR
jgi:isopenicillin N synthase-like dioxygenase